MNIALTTEIIKFFIQLNNEDIFPRLDRACGVYIINSRHVVVCSTLKLICCNS